MKFKVCLCQIVIQILWQGLLTLGMHVPKGLFGVCVCVPVYLSVTMKSPTYLVCTSKLQCYLWCFQSFCCVAFTENALFKSSGIICRPVSLFLLSDELPMDRRESDNFFSTKLVCRFSDSSYNTTD